MLFYYFPHATGSFHRKPGASLRTCRRLLLASVALLVMLAAPLATAQSSDSDLIRKITAFGGPLDDDDQFGIDVARIGDVDGDGVDDALVGAHLDDDGASDPTDDRFNSGAAYVLFMNADGTVDRWQKLSVTEGMPTGFALDKNDRFGIAVAGIGDLNEDGVPDVAIGAHDDDDGEGGSGAIYIVFLNADGTAAATQKISNTSGTPANFSINQGDLFGSSIASIGDLDGDNIAELAVGAPNTRYTPDGTDFNRAQYGAVYILFLNGPPSGADDPPVGTVRVAQEVSESNVLTYTSPGVVDENGVIDLRIQGGDVFGTSVTGLGDVDGDGIPDLAVGNPEGENRNRGSGTFRSYDSGRVHILALNSDGTPKTVSVIDGDDPNCDPATDPQCLKLGPGAYFGASINRLDDLDGDGTDELVVGAAAGSSFIYSGYSGVASRGLYVLFSYGLTSGASTPQRISLGAALRPGIDAGETSGFGTGAAVLGDLDGDGSPTVLAGMTGPRGDEAGAAFTVSLNADGSTQREHRIDNSTDLNVRGDLPLGVLDALGRGAANVGDVNGDGVTDLAVSVAGGTDGDATGYGGVYMLFLDANGKIKDYQVIYSESGTGFDPVLELFDDFGASLAGPGDVDGDGTPDLFVGAPGTSDGGGDAGAGYVLFLNGPPAQAGEPGVATVRAYQKISATEGGPSGGLDVDGRDRFGASAVGIGDLDGDQTPDLAVGAPDADVGGSFVGAVHILFMNPDGTVREAQKLAPGSGMPSGFALDSGDEFGQSLANMGLLNTGSDAVVDLAVGAPGDDDGGNSGFDSGAMYVLFLNPTGTADAVQKISLAEGAPASLSLLENEFMGESSAGVGDVDGDAIPDLLVGSPKNDDGGGGSRGFDAGAIRVFLLNRDGTARSVQKISNSAGAPSSFTLLEDDDFGTSLAVLGDLDGDGAPNVFVGAPGDDTNVRGAGAGYLVSIQTDGTLPVELSDFTGQMDEGRVRLQWTTASETNNGGFHIERRTTPDGRFEMVSFREGAGTTTEARTYRFVDRQVPFGAETLTYRLRQVDLDGTVTLSDPVDVRLRAPATLKLHAPFPNPVRSSATLRVEVPDAARDDARLVVYDVLGRQVTTLMNSVGETRAEHTIDTRRWASGVYFVRLTAGGEVRTQRLVVVR